MSVPLPSTSTLLHELRAQLRHNYPAGRIVVAVDGRDATRTREFADSLAAVLAEDGSAVIRASLTDFLRPPAERGAEPAPADIDASTLTQVLIGPFRSGDPAGFQLSAARTQRETAPDNAVLVIDGAFAQMPPLRDQYTFVVWTEVSESQLAAREGRSMTTPLTDAEAAYARSVRPLRDANALIDVSDAAHPFEFYRDFC